MDGIHERRRALSTSEAARFAAVKMYTKASAKVTLITPRMVVCTAVERSEPRMLAARKQHQPATNGCTPAVRAPRWRRTAAARSAIAYSGSSSKSCAA
eukprot:scaffold20778_cov69-Phaeocystis_antarctica.AAC.2